MVVGHRQQLASPGIPVPAQGPDLAGAEVAEQVAAGQLRPAAALVHEPPDHGDSLLVPVLEYRRDETGLITPIGIPAHCPLHARPAVVAAPLDEVDLLAVLLADVPHPDQPGERVEAEAPGIAQAEGPDLLAPAALVAGERVVRGNPVPLASGIDVEPQDRPEKGGAVLAVVVAVLPLHAAAVSEAHVEVAVGTELDVAAVVAVGRLGNNEADPLLRVGAVRVLRGNAELRQHGAETLPGVVHEEAPVGGEPGMEGQPEEAGLRPEVARLGLQVDEDGAGVLPRRVEHPDQARLVGDEKAAAAVPGRSHEDRGLHRQGGERPHQGEGRGFGGVGNGRRGRENQQEQHDAKKGLPAGRGK